MPTPDRYAQNVQYTALGDSPNLEWLGDQLANGILPHTLLTFDSATHRASVLTGALAPALSKVPYLTYLKDSKRIEAWIGGAAGAWIEIPFEKRLFKYKNDFTPRTSTTATADPHLQVTVEPNSVYTLSAFLVYEGHDNADMKIGFSGPAGISGTWWPGGPDSSAAAYAAYPRWGPADLATTIPVGAIGAATLLVAEPRGLVITGGSGGTFSLIWGQSASSATPTILRTHSWLRLDRQ